MAKEIKKKRPYTRRGITRTFTTEEREKIKQCAIIGIPQARIAELLDCSVNTLRKHCIRELEYGFEIAHIAVAGALYANAVDLNNFNAQKFWLACKGGWREQDENANAPPGVLNINLYPTKPQPAE